MWSGLPNIERKNGFDSVPVLTKIPLSLARAHMPVPTSMILRVILERENMPPLHILWSVVSHTVKMEIGTCLASNFLVQMWDGFLPLSSKRSVHAKVVKPDAMAFNLVLDACVRFKSSLKGQEIVDLMSQTGVIDNAHSPLLLPRSMKWMGRGMGSRNWRIKLIVCVLLYDSLLKYT